MKVLAQLHSRWLHFSADTLDALDLSSYAGVSHY